MGTVDSYTKQFMSNNHIFAEVYNFLLGKKVINPDKLSPIEVEELYITTKLPGDTDKDVQKFRDVMKKYATAMTDGKASYVLLGIENQTLIDYAMSARIMIYDAMRYYKQLQDISAKHKKAKDTSNSEEFVGGFTPTDKLLPVITVVVYYGTKPWNAPCDLFGLLDDNYAEFKSLMNNYSIRVFEASTMSDEELKQLETELRCVMSFIKNSRDKEKLDKILNEDEGFKHMDQISVCVINAVTDAKIRINEKEATVDMCQAISDMRRISHEEGLLEGMRKGEASGYVKGEAKGRMLGFNEGEASGMLKVAKNMLLHGMSVSLVSNYTGLSIDIIEKIDLQKS